MIKRLIIRFLLFILEKFGISPDDLKTTGELILMSEIKEGEVKYLKIAPKTANGNPAKYQTGSVIAESSDPSVATAELDPENELRIKVTAVDGSNNESVVISAQLDGDPDDDEVRTLVGTKSYTVTQGEATVFELEEEESSEAGSVDLEPEPVTDGEAGSVDLEPEPVTDGDGGAGDPNNA